MSDSRLVSRRQFLRGAAMVGVGAALAACAPAAAPAPAAPGDAAPAAAAVNLRFITNHGESDQPLFKKVLDNFAEREPGIVIEHLDIAGTEFYNAINTQGAGGQLPDVWYTRTFDVPVYASKNWTISLQPYVDRDADEVDVDDFWPAQYTQMQWRGELYALPYDFSNMAIYYNKDLFDAKGVAYPTDADWTWDDLLQVALPFVEKEGDEFTAWGMMISMGNWIFHGNLFGWGGQVWSDDFRTFLANSPENEACFEWFISARKQGLYPEAGAAPEGVNPFMAGLVPMTFEGSWATVNLRANIGDRFDFDCIALPKSPTGAPCINAAGGAWGIAVNSANPDAAWTFNKYLTSTEGTNILISEPLRSIPGRQSSVPLWNETAAQGGLPPANVGVFAEQMAVAHAAPYPPYWQDYTTAWNNIVVPVLNGSVDESAAEMLTFFEEEVERIIEQNMASLA